MDVLRLTDDVAAPARAPGSFESFYRAELGRVLMLAWTLTGDRRRAEELAQDAFEATLRRWPDVQHYDDAAAWVRRVVANKSASRVRRLLVERRALERVRARHVVAVPGAPTLPDEELWQAVRDLPGRQRQVVGLHYVEDRSVEEIALILDMAPSTVKVHLHRGRRALAGRLAKSSDEEAQP
jgi:RNA polymerase sigma-70 factor (ECF subfamily)